MTKVRTCLWFVRDGHKAASFYASLIPDSRLETEVDPEAETSPMVVNLTIGGTPYMFLTAGQHYQLTPAVSIFVLTKDQAETDYLWAELTADGGEESRCGWLVDRFGVSWQIIPEALMRCTASPDREAAGRAFQAMMTMRKIDVAAIEAAFAGG